MSNNLFYGWYDDPDQPRDKPTHNPPFDGPCPICGSALTDVDMRTHGLMYTKGYANRSYFYRSHRTCDDKYPCAGDEFIFKLIERNGD